MCKGSSCNANSGHVSLKVYLESRKLTSCLMLDNDKHIPTHGCQNINQTCCFRTACLSKEVILQAW